MLRDLGPADLPALQKLIDRDPLTNLFVDYRVGLAGLQQRWLGGNIWGYFEAGELVSACHAAANFVPIEATDAAIDAFAIRALASPRSASSIVGPQISVQRLWSHLEPSWGPARSLRFDQPFMAISTDCTAAPDPRVRRVLMDEFDTLYPSCVAMFVEEVGLDPEGKSGSGYRARVSQLIAQGWSFAIIEDGEVLFKAEVGAATTRACQIQGMYVRPDLRGQGIAASAMAAVVNEVRTTVAPIVTLYVNDHNVAARRTYERVGFQRTATFATVLF